MLICSAVRIYTALRLINNRDKMEKTMRRIITFLAALILLSSGFPVLADDAAPDLVILYTGDVRGSIKCTG